VLSVLPLSPSDKGLHRPSDNVTVAGGPNVATFNLLTKVKKGSLDAVRGIVCLSRPK